jgi:hypothetical protein
MARQSGFHETSTKQYLQEYYRDCLCHTYIDKLCANAPMPYRAEQLFLPLATSFVPIWLTPPPGYNIGLIIGSGSPASWQSGQNATATTTGLETWEVTVTCTSASECEAFDFAGAWVGTQLAPTE